MSSFCGFCGAKSAEGSQQFCSECGGALEHSIQDIPHPGSTMPLPALTPKTSEDGVVLSRSFVDLIRQEASIGKETSPVELSRSFLHLISETPSLESPPPRDTTEEVMPTPREPKRPLPDFLTESRSLSALSPMTLPIESAGAQVMKLPKISAPGDDLRELQRDTLPEATPALRSWSLEKNESATEPA